MREAQFVRAELRAGVVTAWLAGLSVREINARLGISSYLVNRIIRSIPGLVDERARRVAEEARRQRAALDAVEAPAALEWSVGHLAQSLAEGAASLGLSVARLRCLLGERASLHPPRRPSDPRFTDEQILGHVRVWVNANGMSGVGYRVAAREHGWPSLATVTSRFGSWRRALHVAGFSPEPALGGRPRQWTDEELADVVACYFAEAGPWCARGLRDWLEAVQGRPSFSLVRKRLGPWPDLVGLADRAIQKGAGSR